MRRRSSKSLEKKHIRRSSSILSQPLELEEILPLDVLTSYVTTTRSFSIRNAVKKATSWYIRSNTMKLLVFLASLLSCALFVVDTYDKYGSRYVQRVMVILDFAIFSLFAMDYIFNILYATSKVSYIFSFRGIVDLASLASITNAFTSPDQTDLSFLPLLRLLRNFKLLRMFQLTAFVDINDPQPLNPSDAIFFETLSLGLSICLAWFLGASVLYSIVQQDADAFIYNSDSNFDMQKDLTLFDCIYIQLVLISTLGFGDFSPNNFYGRLFVVVMMVMTLTIIPLRVGQLVESVGKKVPYRNQVCLESLHMLHLYLQY